MSEYHKINSVFKRDPVKSSVTLDRGEGLEGPWTQLRIALSGDGWQEGQTPRINAQRSASQARETIDDLEVCEESSCRQCGKVGLVYVPFARREEYVAVARCNQCGWSEVFSQ